MLIDTHAHLDFPDFAADLSGVLERAQAAGVTRVLTVGTSLESSARAIALAEKYPQVFAVIGVHPNSASEAPEDVLLPLRELARHPRVVAIGETGLDYHRLASSKSPAHQEDVETLENARGDELERSRQARVFQQQLKLAAELGLNVVVHERDAWEDTLALLDPFAGRLRAVFHCFGKSPDHAKRLTAAGHLVSFTGLVTFKSAKEAQATAAQISSDSFMVETDCPFLAPVPYRGKRCEPAHTRQVAEHVASLRNDALESLAARTTANAEAFFRFSR